MTENHRVDLYSLEQALAKSFMPCKTCRPDQLEPPITQPEDQPRDQP